MGLKGLPFASEILER